MLIIIQARMGSTRLPGKILAEICGTPSIIYQIQRIRPLLGTKNKLVVATTKNKEDDELCDLLQSYDIDYYRGSETNVFERFLKCAESYNATHIIRINGDCPLICPKVINKVINIISNDTNIDYASTILKDTFPIGMHVEAMNMQTLKRVNKMKLTREEKEHVTPAIYRNNKIFNLYSVERNDNANNYRVTVDYEEDLEVIEDIASNFSSNDYSCDDIVNFLKENPEIAQKNSHLLKKQRL
tara:strand:+ start:2824 stop:3546 length:723 start_codon:yes stop_codon:yes gene_type:complete